jgi:hypothetical protein
MPLSTHSYREIPARRQWHLLSKQKPTTTIRALNLLYFNALVSSLEIRLHLNSQAATHLPANFFSTLPTIHPTITEANKLNINTLPISLFSPTERLLFTHPTSIPYPYKTPAHKYYSLFVIIYSLSSHPTQP